MHHDHRSYLKWLNPYHCQCQCQSYDLHDQLSELNQSNANGDLIDLSTASDSHNG